MDVEGEGNKSMIPFRPLEVPPGWMVTHGYHLYLPWKIVKAGKPPSLRNSHAGFFPTE
jgi:hypothetical protein